MKPSKCIYTLARRKEFLEECLIHIEPNRTAKINFYKAEIAALDWAIVLMNFELTFRRQKIASGTWSKADDFHFTQLFGNVVPDEPEGAA